MAGVGDRIRTRRMELGWTQEHLCQRVGLSKGFLSDLENEKRSVSAENLLQLSRALGVSLDFLMTGSASKETSVGVALPTSLATFAADEGLTLRETLTLLDMQKQIVAYRSVSKKDALETFDWRKFYEGVREFLEHE